MTKQAERDYPLKMQHSDLMGSPYFGPRVIREFAGGMELLQKVVPPKGRILDLGCGTGWTSQFLAHAGYDVLGFDISESMVELARERTRHDEDSVRFQSGDMEEMELEQHDFDAATIFDALHHCPGWPKVLERVCAHLRPGGHLLLLEPSWLHLISPHARQASKRYGVTELGFTRLGLRMALHRAGFDKVWTCYDCGPIYRGVSGFLLAQFRLWCNYWFCFPRLKQIMLARKALR